MEDIANLSTNLSNFTTNLVIAKNLNGDERAIKKETKALVMST